MSIHDRVMTNEKIREAAEEIGNVERNPEWRHAQFEATVILLLGDIARALDNLWRQDFGGR